jgi:protein TonB
MALRFKHFIGGLFSGISLSIVVHASAAGGLYLWIAHGRGPAIVADLDLSMQPLINQPANAGGGRARAEEEWLIAPKNKSAPAPARPVEKKVETPTPIPAPAEETAAEGAPCVEPCPEGDGSGGGGTGEGHGLYVPASETSRKPRWVGNFITSADYPRLARENGKDGRVIVSVFIDDKGQVQDVRLLQGAYEALNDVALRKVRAAKFTPAFDAQGKAVACQVVLPIRFELR